MTTETPKKQFAIRLSGYNCIDGIHYLTKFGGIKSIPMDDPSVQRFETWDEAQQWVEGYDTRPFRAFNALVVEI